MKNPHVVAIVTIMLAQTLCPATTHAKWIWRSPAYPWCAVGEMVVSDPNDGDHFIQGTGCLVGPDVVLTNRHVVRDKRDRVRERDAVVIRFVPASGVGEGHIDPLESSGNLCPLGRR